MEREAERERPLDPVRHRQLQASLTAGITKNTRGSGRTTRFSRSGKLGDQLFDRPPFRLQNPPKPLDSTTSPFNHHYTKTNATSRMVL